MGNKVLKGNKDEEFKVKLGNQYLLLNKATTAENLQAFDIQVDNGKKEILQYLHSKIKIEDLKEEEEEEKSDNSQIIDTHVKPLQYKAKNEKDFSELNFGNDKLIIDLMKEMKSFEILRTEIGKIIDLGQNADSLNI